MSRPIMSRPATQPSVDDAREVGLRRTGPPPARTVVEPIAPLVDGGAFPAKASIGEPIDIVADVFAEGHDIVVAEAAVVATDQTTEHIELVAGHNDRWHGRWTPRHLGSASIQVIGAVDPWATWLDDARRWTDGQDLAVHREIGARLLEQVPTPLASPTPLAELPHRRIAELVAGLRGGTDEDLAAIIDDTDLASAMSRLALRDPGAAARVTMAVWVEPAIARCSAWYEFFPRSTVLRSDSHTNAPDGHGTGTGTDGPHHGTLIEAIGRLDHIADLGFDVVYLPPIHPIGTTHRKGPDNCAEGGPDDVGSPWAIGGAGGGHDAIHPELGTVEDLARLVREARGRGLEIALDLAFQCSPDHPWVTEHPTWFRHQPDGSIRYAENPPKRYQDIYPLDFTSEDWAGLWSALADIVRYWLGLGIRIFRVDNPHTKPFPFWEWLIATIRAEDPGVVFLAEAFSRPRIMERLAKVGFSQSYTYFTWRESPGDIREYFGDLTTRCIDFLRPNAWPNTPDILPRHLQDGGRPAFSIRAILAATISANWGVYGPAFELLEHEPLAAGSEEYRSSEKYQLREWDLDRSESLAPLLRRLNEIRNDHPALQLDRHLSFCDVDGDQLVAYVKPAPPGIDGRPAERILTVVNLDPHGRRSGWVDVSPAQLGHDWDSLPWGSAFEVVDLLGGATYEWHVGGNWVELDPHGLPAHIFAIRTSGIRPVAS